MADVVVERRPTYRYWYGPQTFIGNVVQTVVGLIELALALRLILKLFGASDAAPFVAAVYRLTDALVAPFAGAFASWQMLFGALDLSTLFAMIGYALIGWLFLWILSFMDATP